MKSTLKTYLSEMWLPSYDRERWVSKNDVEMEALSALADKVAWRAYISMFVYLACIATLLAWAMYQRPITDHATLAWFVFVLGGGWMFNVKLIWLSRSNSIASQYQRCSSVWDAQSKLS